MTVLHPPFPKPIALSRVITVGFLFSTGCTSEKDTAQTVAPLAPEEPTPQPQTPSLRRLSISQYKNVIGDTFGEGLMIPSNLEPDIEVEGFKNLGASLSSLSPVGIERYESASYTLAAQITAEPQWLSPWFSCNLTVTPSQSCISSGIDALGKQLWRRTLTVEERTRLNGLYQNITLQSDGLTGLEYTLAAMLQSPNFLYRVEMDLNALNDEAVAENASIALDSWGLASRLSFFLWNSGPDATLLSLAESNELFKPEIYEAQVQRMMDDPRFQRGLRNFFDEMLHLYELDSLTKDPYVFTQASPDLYASAKEETFRSIEYVLQENMDFRELLTLQTTFVDRRLATLYGIAAPLSEGFGQVELPEHLGRRGLLTQASTLNLHAHSTASSPTLRGVFIRKTLLCQSVPPPPANVDTSIPEATEDAPTMRDRLEQHFEDPSCAGCHKLMDLVGLGLENFDGIGQWRNYENDTWIDPSGSIDGEDFLDAWEMGALIAEHPNLGGCLSDHLYSYATGHRMTYDEIAQKEWMVDTLEYTGWSLQSLIQAIALSEAFRVHGPLTAESMTSEQDDTGNADDTGGNQ